MSHDSTIPASIQRQYDYKPYPDFRPDQPYVVRTISLKHKLTTAHFHTGVEIGVCLSDSGRMYLNGTFYPMRRGSVYFLDSMLPHGHENIDLLVCEAQSDCIISATPVRGDLRLYEPFISLRMGIAPVLPPIPSVKKHLRKSVTLSNSKTVDWPLWAWPHILASFTAIAKVVLPKIRAVNNPGQIKNQQILYKVLDYIHAHFTRPIHIQELAQQCYLSPSRFAHLFSQLMHCSPIEYRNLLRVGKAVELLTQTTDKINIISEKCGFNSLAQFNMLFKKVTGNSPNNLRKNIGSAE